MNDKNLIKLIFFASSLVSVVGFIYFSSNELHLAYGDALSRLNIARKMLDNLTPGFGQLGNIWLPLPHVLMLTFIWNNYMWHTGLAGYLMNGVAFVFTIYFLYRIGVLAFKSKLVGLLMAFVALTNINFLYMQTTSMTEVLYVCLVTGSTYFLILWSKTNRIYHLVFAALFVSASTLTRYEGYFVFALSVLIVAVISYIKTKNIKESIEGNTVVFATLAVTGIILWMLYSWAIFKDPFYWKNIYSGEKSIISTDSALEKVVTDQGTVVSQKHDLGKALFSYWNASAQMNGIIITIIASVSAICFIFFLIRNYRRLKRNPQWLILIIPAGTMLFVVFTLFMGNIPLDLPDFTLKNLLSRNTSYEYEYNIRYGLALLPLIAIFFGWLAYKSKYIAGFLFFFLFLQLFTTFYTPFFTIYQLPMRLNRGNTGSGNSGERASSIWFKQHYDKGLIMISALQHDPEMFYLGLDYKNFIHEGTQYYWLESRDKPQKYATWIYMFKSTDTSKNDPDAVTKYLKDNKNLKKYFNKVYDDGTYEIYKIKDKPLVDISKK